MREHSRLRRALAAGSVTALTLLLAPAASAAETGGEVSVSNARVRVGEQVQVFGSGMPPGEPVAVRVCGAPNASGRLACGTGLEGLQVAADGTLTTALQVDEPTGPCPCTVVVDLPAGPPVSTRLDLLGHPVAKAPKAPEIVVDAAEVGRSDGLGHLFGLAPEPTLTLTLRNAGVSAAQPTLDLSWRDGDGEPVAITDSGVPVIDPGQSVDFEIPLTFGTFAQGEHTVEGQVVVGDLFAPVEATTTVAPWGLYAVGLLALAGLAVARVRRVTGADPGRDAASPSVTDRPERADRPEPATPPAGVSVPRPRSRRSSADDDAVMVGPPRLTATPLQPLSPLDRLKAAAPRDEHEATVADALSAIRERTEAAPARLPDRHEVPPQAGRRAERGGKRAARPEKGRWIIRR